MTTSAPSGSEASSAFSLLDPRIQRWIWDQGWTQLRHAQAQAVRPILAGDVDVIISAATASGKTEAAFLPILSAIAAYRSSIPSVDVLYLSPLKALINDQFDRLSELAARVDVPVRRWHGDVNHGRKLDVLRKPAGLLLITPESLEALFVLRGTLVPTTFGGLHYVVVDELHSFIGTERGAQLQSLLHRLELALGRRVPRIALSATLGDMASAADYLRPAAGQHVHHIVADDDSQALKLQLRGYLASEPVPAGDSETNTPTEPSTASAGEDAVAIASDLFLVLRGSDNLIFANSRRQVEVFADLLRSLAEERHVPNEFFAHHGSLSKDLRQYVEQRLKDRTLPVNVVCTSTLEMGIDIGAVGSIAQIGPPPSVATLRQRLGRSGRRGDPAVLRMYIAEQEVTSQTAPPDALRAELVQAIAAVNLLIERWYEPPDPGDLHLSTLVQQLLSVVAQNGGVLASQAYSVLCGPGPFGGLSKGQFATLLHHLGAIDVLVQSPDGTLLLGTVGERVVNHYSFYVAFATPDEWRLMSDGRPLGSLPMRIPLRSGLFLIFAGRRWRVAAVDAEHKVVDLVPAPGGRPPRFVGTGAPVHDRVRMEMFAVYEGASIPPYLDATAAALLAEARKNFVRYRLDARRMVQAGKDTYLFLWMGDRVAVTVTAILAAAGMGCAADGLALSIANISPVELAAHLLATLAGPMPDANELAATVQNKLVEKFDRFLPEELVNATFAAWALDIPRAWQALEQVAASTVADDQATP